MNTKAYEKDAALVDQSEQEYALKSGSMNADKMRLLHHAMGMAGEAGELVDAIKKHVFYSQPLDTENVLEEVSDCLWYQVRLLAALGFSLDEAMEHNNKKLKIRYAKGFSNEAAKERADKNG